MHQWRGRKLHRPSSAIPREFIEMGGKGDQELFGYDGGSRYSAADIAAPKGALPKAKIKGKGKGTGR